MTLYDRPKEVHTSEWKKIIEGDLLRKQAQDILKFFTHRVGEMIRNARFEEDLSQAVWVKIRPHAESELQKLKRAEATVSVKNEDELRRFKSIVEFSSMLLNCDDELSEVEVLSEAAQSLIGYLKDAEFISDVPAAPILKGGIGHGLLGIDRLGGDIWGQIYPPSGSHAPPVLREHQERRFGTTPAQAGVILCV